MAHKNLVLMDNDLKSDIIELDSSSTVIKTNDAIQVDNIIYSSAFFNTLAVIDNQNLEELKEDLYALNEA